MILPAFREICMQVKKQQVELNMEQWTGSKLRKEYVRAVYCHLAYTWHASWETYMQVRKQQLELDMEQQTGSK